MITLDIDQNFAASEDRLSEATLQSLSEIVQEEFGSQMDGRITLSYVSDAEIRRLNRMYRGKDATTDVLSFSYLEQPLGHGDQLGDIVISMEQAKRQAQGDLELELADLMVHGILHVLGYDHEELADAKIMFPLQDRLVKTLL